MWLLFLYLAILCKHIFFSTCTNAFPRCLPSRISKNYTYVQNMHTAPLTQNSGLAYWEDYAKHLLQLHEVKLNI